MSRNRRHDQLADFEDPEVSSSGREPWAYRTEYVGGEYYPQNQPQVERRSIGQDMAAYAPNVPRTLNTPHSAYSAPQSDERNQYHVVVESTRRLNLSAQDPRNAGATNRESNSTLQHGSHSFNPEALQQNVRYHLSSALENPPRHPSDIGRYDRRISNSQLDYRSGYPAQSENDYISPPAPTGPSYPNSNPSGYNNIPSAFTNPSQPNVNHPAWGGQHIDPLGYGVPFRPLNGVVASRRDSAEEDTELAPAHTIGPTDISQTLDESYRVRDHPRRYFKDGQVFAVLWHEPAGKMGTTLTLYNEHVHSKIRRMVVFSQKKDCCWCLAIHTYGGRGTDKPSIDLKTHAVIRTPDVQCYQKPSAMIQDEFVVTPEEGETLLETSVLDFGKVYTVEHNVKVKSIGKLTSKGAALLHKHWARQSIPTPPRHSRHGHH